MQGLKGFVRDLLPPRLQVPIKYQYGRLRRELEPEMALLPALVSRGDRAIDVGGNRGTYAYRLEQLGARVEVFEPNPVCLRVLRDWASQRATVSVHAVALSAASGTAELAIPIDQAGVEHDASASIEHGAGADVRLETVPIATLDSYGFRDAVLIKIDVEGHEQSVIEGALETIAASLPALLIEIEQRHLAKPIQAVFARIQALGYQGFFLRNGALEPLAGFDPATHQVIADFDRNTGLYYNNFLFLADAKLAAGAYEGLVGR
uniref:FkbM family methyltransferase n=1 Tax=uncultured Sphingomonas sp. TaxID=158754 RepID=UPI0035CC462C